METGIWSITKNKYLTEEEFKEFQDIVTRDIKMARIPKNVQDSNLSLTDDEFKQLFANKHIWIYCLRITRRELELQMSQYKIDKKQKQIDLETATDPDTIQDIKDWLMVKARWRSNAMKMLSIVEQKVMYLKTMLDQVTIKG